jgi:hypothetical protein
MEATMNDLAHMIQALRARGLYNIMFRNAGVGLLFYEGVYDEEGFPPGDWKKDLRVNKYYDTLIEAVEAEYRERVRTCYACESTEDVKIHGSSAGVLYLCRVCRDIVDSGRALNRKGDRP